MGVCGDGGQGSGLVGDVVALASPTKSRSFWRVISCLLSRGLPVFVKAYDWSTWRIADGRGGGQLRAAVFQPHACRLYDLLAPDLHAVLSGNRIIHTWRFGALVRRVLGIAGLGWRVAIYLGLGDCGFGGLWRGSINDGGHIRGKLYTVQRVLWLRPQGLRIAIASLILGTVRGLAVWLLPYLVTRKRLLNLATNVPTETAPATTANGDRWAGRNGTIRLVRCPSLG